MMYSFSNPKIDIYIDGVYKCSTNWFPTCKAAKAKYSKDKGIAIDRIKARINKG